MPRPGWERATLGILGLAAAGLTLVAALAIRPGALVYPANQAFGERPIQLWVDSARLEAPLGWTHPRHWQWRIEGFSLVSHQPGTPTLLAQELVIGMPDLYRSFWERSIVLPRVDAVGFTVAVLRPSPPPPRDERDAWPLRALVVDHGLLSDFQLVMRDAAGTPIWMDRIDAQVDDFRYDIGHRQMFGRAATRGAHVVVGPLEAHEVQAIPVVFTGTTLDARGFGQVAGQRVEVRFAVDGLFRAAAEIHAEFELVGADLRALVNETLDDDAPDVHGSLSGRAIFDSKPPSSNLDITFRLDDGEVVLAEDTKGIILTALELAPFVQLDDHRLRLGRLSGKVALTDGVITLTDGVYQADRSVAQVDARIDRQSLRGRVAFEPLPGHSGLAWGMLLSGTAKNPKLSLADPVVLEAWTVDGDRTQPEIRVDAREARRDQRQADREAKAEARRDDASD